MDIHNTTEDIVFSKVQAIFDSIRDEGNPEKFCLCNRCRLDTTCYVLNRSEPRYVVSNRGVARLEKEGFRKQQIEADIAALAYEGLKRVNHNQRPNVNHSEDLAERAAASNMPVFNIPTILGRVFNGVTFAPISGIKIELRRNGELVIMKDYNWQNPYTLVSNTEGTFTFWPNSIPAEAADIHKIFEYLVKIETSDYEPLTHFFKIPVISEVQSAVSYSMGRTFKLPDLYLFPPGGAGEEMQYNA
ncbi:MAG: late competence development ComFB family protein [Treponema sp.]|jgi:competence protein ComFB|nr:late competence development ComFB family protein [Treponema sp.]